MVENFEYFTVIQKEREKGKKTDVFELIGQDGMSILGYIKWWGAWRKYCFFPQPYMVFDHKCLTAIAELTVLKTKLHLQSNKKQ